MFSVTSKQFSKCVSSFYQQVIESLLNCLLIIFINSFSGEFYFLNWRIVSALETRFMNSWDKFYQ